MTKKVIRFDNLGNPVGDYSATYASDLGDITRAQASITYEKWSLVDSDQKSKILTEIKGKYDVSDTTDAAILLKANVYWRKFKNRVRKHSDFYATNEERKRHCPKNVRQEDWEGFMEMESSTDAIARRARGRSSRECMQAKQRSGRKGAARIAYEMRERQPDVPVTRTRLFLALHSGSDEIHLTEEHSSNLEKVKHICEQNPSSVLLDIDHDPVNQVYGRDKKRLRGVGGGISRRGLAAAAPAIIQLDKQISITSTLNDKVNRMEALLQKHDEYLGSIVARQGPNIQSVAETSRSQSGNRCQPPAGFPPNVMEKACKLYSMRGEHVASGRAIVGDRSDEHLESPERFETYEVFLDRILLPNVTSTNKDTLGEEDIGAMITWPKAFTVLAH